MATNKILKMIKAIVYDRYGSKKGLLRHLYYRLAWLFGAYRSKKALAPSLFNRLIFVCSGNICRSPVAEAYACHLGFNAFSCGLHCTDDHPADPRAEAYAQSIGLNLAIHKTKNIRNFKFQESDLIIGMEPKHVRELKELNLCGATVALAGAFCNPPIPYIHDPFNCSKPHFTLCEDRVAESVRGLLG